MTDPAAQRPAPDGLADLLGDVLAALSRLVAAEVALARAEIARALRRAAVAVILLGVAALLVLAALMTLAGAAVAWAVVLGVPQPLAGVIVGVGLVLLACGIAWFALIRLAPQNLVPRRSLASLRRVAETLKPKVTPDGTDSQNPKPAPHPAPDRNAD